MATIAAHLSVDALREDEPHPVTPLPPRPQFGEHVVDDGVLAAPKRSRSKGS